MSSSAIYLRVSSRQQDTKSQEPDLERWAKAQDTSVKWCRDKSTGRTMNRPAWKHLKADMRVGKVVQIVVWRLDRLGRTASGLTALFDDMPQGKVNLVSLKDGLDLSPPAGRLMATEWRLPHFGHSTSIMASPLATRPRPRNHRNAQDTASRPRIASNAITSDGKPTSPRFLPVSGYRVTVDPSGT